MLNNHPASSVEVGARPVHPIFLPVAAAFLLGAFVTDVLYVETVPGNVGNVLDLAADRRT